MTRERLLQLLESTKKNLEEGRPVVGSDPAELVWLLLVALRAQQWSDIYSHMAIPDFPVTGVSRDP